MHAPNALLIKLDGRCQRFAADVGVDQNACEKGSVLFRIFADSEKVFESPVQRWNEPALHVDQDVTGRTWLIIQTETGGDGPGCDWADLADAELHCKGAP